MHSVRIVFTQRSATAFIFGHCGADFLISMSSDAKTVSNAAVKIEYRSRIRYRNAPARSPTPAPLKTGTWASITSGHGVRHLPTVFGVLAIISDEAAVS